MTNMVFFPNGSSAKEMGRKALQHSTLLFVFSLSAPIPSPPEPGRGNLDSRM